MGSSHPGVTLSDRATSERISASYSGLIAAVRGLLLLSPGVPGYRAYPRRCGVSSTSRATVALLIAGLLRHRALPVALVPYPTDPEADDQGCAAARRWRGDRSRRRPEWFVGADRLEESR